MLIIKKFIATILVVSLLGCNGKSHLVEIKSNLLKQGEIKTEKIIKDNEEYLLSVIDFISKKQNETILGRDFNYLDKDMEHEDPVLFALTKKANELGIIMARQSENGTIGFAMLSEQTVEYRFTFSLTLKNEVVSSMLDSNCEQMSKKNVCKYKNVGVWVMFYTWIETEKE